MLVAWAFFLFCCGWVVYIRRQIQQDSEADIASFEMDAVKSLICDIAVSEDYSNFKKLRKLHELEGVCLFAHQRFLKKYLPLHPQTKQLLSLEFLQFTISKLDP